MNRNCKVCHKIIRGRSDKIYCSLGCKNYYHKEMRYISKKAAIEINGFLKRNYIILWEILAQHKIQIKVYRNVLVQKGFRFKYHTHYHVNSRNKVFFYIYDLAWMEFSDDEILIVRKS